MAKNIILALLLILVIYLIYQTFFNNPDPNIAKVKIKSKIYTLEIAKTIPQKTKGLMNRTSLCQDCGMIFVSGFEMPQVFWMKNTLIPLDIIFLDKQGMVINIANAVPEPHVADTALNTYHSTSPSKFVIELNAGTTNNLGLKAGDTIDLTSIK